MSRLALLTLTAIAVFAIASPVLADQEVCPDPKTASQVDGDLNDIVLPEGTLVCVKGATDLVWVTADGTTTLFDLLGNGHDVSHYHVAEQPTTTTTVPDTTTTTTFETTTTTVVVTTTTVPETTTTTDDDGTTTTSTVVTTTTTHPSTTTTDPGAPTTTTPPEDAPTLPYTGPGHTLLLIAAAIALVATGAVLVRTARG